MESAGRIDTLWGLLRASSAEGRRTRRRLGVGAALAVLMSGLLTAVGLASVVFALALFALLAVGGTAAVRALRRHWPSVRSQSRRIAAALVRWSGIALAKARTGLTRVGGVGSSAARWLRWRGPRLAVTCARHASRATRYVATRAQTTFRRVRERTVAWLREGVEHAQRITLSTRVSPVDPHHEALRLNAAGSRQRRNGAYAEAVELHRRALEILGRVEAPHTVALTQNNLALALSHLGDDSRAIALFEEAAATLRELGEEEHEGRIIANLGLIHRRQGRSRQSDDVLQLALTKLRPTSKAYEAVEAELTGAR
jgi:tetratricopeptide (TPR) repeat protein